MCPFTRPPLTTRQWLDQVRELIADDIAAFKCDAEIARLDTILAEGTSGDRHIVIFTKVRTAGRKRLMALTDAIDWAASQTVAIS